MKTDESAYELVTNGVRWASNILTELVGNFGTKIPKEAANHFREALSHLHDGQHCMRFWARPQPQLPEGDVRIGRMSCNEPNLRPAPPQWRSPEMQALEKQLKRGNQAPVNAAVNTVLQRVWQLNLARGGCSKREFLASFYGAKS